ncbi:MAG TPA: sulfotransferase [Solirubrobacteraceae bacterium]|nr:sulfotransferase [Solirubrobacteraceae bacterium]
MSSISAAQRGSAHGAPAASTPTRVIYVMGAGHSGSTILGVALGNCADVFYAGEVDEWLLKGSGRFGGEERRRFWGAVRSEMGEAADGLFGERVNRLIERSSAPLRIDRRLQRRRILPGYRRATERLFAAIARVAGVGYVVDTSHFPLRARELQRLSGIELHLIFLTRDPQAVVESNVREISRHEVAERRVRVLGTNVGLWLTQLLSIYVFLRQPRARRILLCYEDFVADPAGVLRQLLDHAGSDAPLPDLGALSVGVPLEGNRLLAAETISIRAPRAPVARWSLLTTLLQWPWQSALGLLRPVARASSRETATAPGRPAGGGE